MGGLTRHSQQVRPSAIRVGRRFRKHLGDVNALARSIARVGLLDPIVVDPQARLIAGARRLAACRLLGWQQTVPVTVVDPGDLVQAEHDENVVRQDFLPSEAVAIAPALERHERAAARQRQLAGLLRGHMRPVVASCHDANGKTRDRVAAYVGLGGRTLDKAKAVVAAATQDPGRFCWPTALRVSPMFPVRCVTYVPGLYPCG